MDSSVWDGKARKSSITVETQPSRSRLARETLVRNCSRTRPPNATKRPEIERFGNFTNVIRVGPRSFITALSSNHLDAAFRKTVWKNPFNFTNTKVPCGGLDSRLSHVNDPNDFQYMSVELHDAEKVKNVHMQLSQGISQGNVEAVKDSLNRRPGVVDQWITPNETPLLKACACGNPEIVKVLLRRMQPDQMIPKTSDKTLYHTPLTVVAVTGNMEIAKYLLGKNFRLINMPGINGHINGQLPVVVAIENGHKEMARYFYNKTRRVFLDEHGTLLILNAIYHKMLDVVLYFLGGNRRFFAIQKHLQIESTPIIVLASKPDLFPSGCRLGPLERIIYACIQVKLQPVPDWVCPNKYYKDTLMRKLLKCLSKWIGIDEMYQLKAMHVQAKKLLLVISETLLAMCVKKRRQEILEEAVLFAVRYGNVDFLVEMIKINSDLLWFTRTSLSRSLFLLAVEMRQEKVFSLLYGLDDRKYLLLADKDCDGNGMLHLAGYLSPPSKLSTVTGAALQMQRELQWFKEVEKIVPEMEMERVNTDGQTPIGIFTKEHQTLRQEAEKCMKYTATSCSLVATLIVTVTFAAVFTVPDNSSRGKPFHLGDRRFIIFIVSDLISCFAACTSVLIFLGILTARYSFEDFLVSLPTKMIAGLSTLFISIAAMLMAFSSALFTMMDKEEWIVAPTILLACLPALLFVLLQYPLLKEMIFSTYGKGIFDKDMKCWLGSKTLNKKD